MTTLDSNQGFSLDGSGSDSVAGIWQRPLLTVLGDVRLLTEAGSQMGDENGSGCNNNMGAGCRKP